MDGSEYSNDFEENGLIGGGGGRDNFLCGCSCPRPHSGHWNCRVNPLRSFFCPCCIGGYKVVDWGMRRGQGLVLMGVGERVGGDWTDLEEKEEEQEEDEY